VLSNLKDKVYHEVTEFLVIALYLWVVFCVQYCSSGGGQPAPAALSEPLEAKWWNV